MRKNGPATQDPSKGLEDLLAVITDPVDRLLLSGRASTACEAEELYLSSAHDEALELLSSPLSDDELAKHPLFVLFRTHGSRPREDDIL